MKSEREIWVIEMDWEDGRGFRPHVAETFWPHACDRLHWYRDMKHLKVRLKKYIPKESK